MKRSLILVLGLLVHTCKITSVDYAQGNVRIISKVKTTINEMPALHLALRNEGEEAVFDVVVTVKAKKDQIDLDVVRAIVDKIDARETVNISIVFQKLGGHSDYDFLTYAIDFMAKVDN